MAGKDVVFVLDLSGSMNERGAGSSLTAPTRLEIAQDAFDQVLQTFVPVSVVRP